MDLEHGHGVDFQGIPQCVTGMAQRTRIENHPIHFSKPLLKPVDDLAFVVGLEEHKRCSPWAGEFLQEVFDLLPGMRSILRAVPLSQEVQIWSIPYQDFHGVSPFSM